MTPPDLQQWHRAGSYIPFNGMQIFTRIEGAGEPLLVLHGFPTASYDYAKLMPLLRNHYQLIFFDFLGYGFSDKPKNHPYSIFEQATITQAVADHYGLRETAVLTHDLGNSVILEVLRRDQSLIKKLFMLNGSVLLDHYRPVITQKLLLHSVLGPLITRFRLIRRPIFARQFGKLFARQLKPDEVADFWQLILHNDGMANYHLLIRYLHERKIHEHVWLDVLKQHTAPLIVIWGQRDPVSVPKIAEAILERRPDTDYYPFDDVGHFPQWEAPERVASILC